MNFLPFQFRNTITDEKIFVALGSVKLHNSCEVEKQNAQV